jgi:hypothetical protein
MLPTKIDPSQPRREHTDEIDEPAISAAVEDVARTLLRRYGIVSWRLLAGSWVATAVARAAATLPPA